MKRPKVLLLNLSGIGCHSYSHGINQQKCVRLLRYSDWLSRCRHLKSELLKYGRCVA